MAVIKFKKMVVSNFKNHVELVVNFGEETKITGANGKGKSGISEAVTWLLYGVDMFGSKFDPTSLNGEGNAKVELLLNVDGKDILLGKELAKAAKYFINEVPEKAGRFDEVVGGLFEKNLFLSIFSPSYFFSQHWQDQRAQLLQYISEPLNKEVLEKLTKVDRERLEEPLKKNTLDEIEKIHRPKIKTLESENERAAGRVSALKEQLENERANYKEVDAEEIKKEMDAIKKSITGAQESNRKAQEVQNQYQNTQRDLERLKGEIGRVANEVNSLVANPKETCEVCGQALEGEAFEHAKNHHIQKVNVKKEKGAALVKEFKSLQEKLSNLEVPIAEYEDTNELQNKFYSLQNSLNAIDRISKMAEQVKQAEDQKEETRKALNTSKCIIDAIKLFNAEKSQLMVDKVNDLLDTLTVKLFSEAKNGSISPTFEVEMDGKPYSKLSTAEKIKAGLELAQVLIKQSGVSIPVFVDNAESILKFTAPTAQLITATVKTGELKIESKGEIE